MAAAAAVGSAGELLAPLRQDLKLMRPDESGDERGRWLIYDPARHSYFEIDQTTFEVLSQWQGGMRPADLIAAVAERFGKHIAAEDVAALVRFVSGSYLTETPPDGDWRQLAVAAHRARPGWGQWLLHHYLFFKVPLFRPQAFLERTLPLASLFYRRGVLGSIAAIGIFGLYLVSRQWDEFLSTFHSYLSLEGIAAFAIALLAIKALHELGHGYSVVRHGGHVPSMGVAFMLMTPMLYTDVTDAWRLRSRRQRLLIDSAGIIVELMIACVATFLWSFLPEGMLKGIVFVAATTGWIMSLAINLNPFMRFDGYFVACDLAGIANLQPRSFALARWHLRELLFGLGEPPPEVFPRATRGWMIAYAWATWAYRLLLFIGIAVLVYYYFFKVLGIALFVVEIVFFVLKPIWSEIMEWRKRGSAIAMKPRAYWTAGSAGAIAVAALVPWSGRVDVPVVVEPISYQRVFPPLAAEIVSMAAVQGRKVAKGDVLAVLHSETLEQKIRVARNKINATRVRRARMVADATDRRSAVVLERELKSATTELAGLLESREELTLRAPFDGEIIEVGRWLHAGRVIGAREPIATVARRSGLQARGYIGEKDVWRIAAGASARFIPDDGERVSMPLRVREIGDSGVANIDIEDLASTNGGPIDASAQRDGRATPHVAQYRVVMDIDPAVAAPERRIRGIAVVDGARQSFADRLWRQVMRVVIREGGA